MKNNTLLKNGFSASLLMILSSNHLFAMDANTRFAQLMSNVEKGCPVVWEDPATPIDDTISPSSLFASDDDQAQFEIIYRASHDVVDPDTNAVTDPVTDSELQAVLQDIRAISFECNAHRKELLESMLTINALDSAAALEAALGVADAIDFSSRQWRSGDFRVTGRLSADYGWIFPVGQTIGADGSGADLEGDEYENLFNVAKGWQPNQGVKTWGGAGVEGVVVLPDMRGRAVFAADNMGGTPRDLVLNDSADTLGGEFGAAQQSISIANLPSHDHQVGNGGLHGHTAANAGNHAHSNQAVGNHSHIINSAGAHNHSMGAAGNHRHTLKSSVYEGSGAGRSDWDYFEGKARPNYQNVIKDAVNTAGNHTHSIGNAGNHAHTANAAGSHNHPMSAAGNHAHTIEENGLHAHPSATVGENVPLNTLSPGIVMNIELKL